MRPRLTYANVVSTICLFLILSGGAAYALDGSNTVFSDDIVNGEVKGADIANGQVAAAELTANSVRSGEVADGQVRSQEIGNGQIQAKDLARGASGARAWGLVRVDGTLLRSKNITAVTHPTDGIYCIDPGSGINPDTSIMVAGEDVASGLTDDPADELAHAEWDSSRTSCPAGAMEVETFVGVGVPGTGGATDFGGFNVFLIDAPFTFVIP
jgi:hypothetical protein